MKNNTITLRPYQIEAVNAVKRALGSKQDCLLTAPCAAGKTVIFSEIVKWLSAHRRRILILLDREQLVSQTAARIQDYLGPGCSVGVACASVSARKDLDAQVVVASRQTLAPMLRNGADLAVNLTILDEAHLVSPKAGQYKTILEKLSNAYQGMRIFGCTATPYRLTGGLIYGADRIFTTIDHSITTEQLLAEGYLVPLTWKVRQSDLNAQLDSVKKASTGDLNEREQAEILGQDIYIQGVYSAWQEHAIGKKTAIFALNIAHAELIQNVFERNGIHTWLIHSKMPTEDVRAAINAFSNGTGVIINVGILTIGSDIPSINCVILARRTLSTALFFQIVGRGARLHPGKKDCTVIDLCGNAMIHGIDPDNPIRQCQGDGGSDEPRIKICPMCETACHVNTRACKVCLFEFPREEAEEGPELEETTTEPQKLVEFKGFETRTATVTRYMFHQAKGKPTPCVRAEYTDDTGRIIARQWLCPQHTGWAQKKAGYYWRDLGGNYPIPKTVQQWLNRQNEISGDPLKITILTAGAYPEVKRVERIPYPESMPRLARSAQA